MLHRNKVITAAEAAGLIKSGDTITVSGLTGFLVPEKIIQALEERFATTGQPRDLTFMEPTPIGAGPGKEHWLQEGLVRRFIITYSDVAVDPERSRLILDGKAEAFVLPLGTAHLLLQEIARGSPGLLTKVGLRTYVDPRIEGGRLNTKEDLVEVVTLRGEEWLLYKSFPINVALIKGSTADEDGNISLEEDPLLLSVFYQAMAARNSGGKVIAQVKRLAGRGSLHPRMVEVPGLLVDAIVVDPAQEQSSRFPGAFCHGIDGQIKIPAPAAPSYPLNFEKIISKRATLELHPDWVINLGGGTPRYVPLIMIEEDIHDLTQISLEHGTLGGVCYGRPFHINPTYFLSYQDVFNLYRGGGLDACFLGFGQTDQEGNVNLSLFGGELLRGPGGAMDIAHDTPKVYFLGSFTRDRLKTETKDGKLIIAQEGRAKKLVRRVDQITMNGRYMWEKGQQVYYITERCVFKLSGEGLVLTEIAPGIDLERDILAQMEFTPHIAPDLKPMDRRVFLDQPMGLRKEWLGLKEADRPNPIPFAAVDQLPIAPYWSLG